MIITRGGLSARPITPVGDFNMTGILIFDSKDHTICGRIKYKFSVVVRIISEGNKALGKAVRSGLRRGNYLLPRVDWWL